MNPFTARNIVNVRRKRRNTESRKTWDLENVQVPKIHFIRRRFKLQVLGPVTISDIFKLYCSEIVIKSIRACSFASQTKNFKFFDWRLFILLFLGHLN